MGIRASKFQTRSIFGSDQNGLVTLMVDSIFLLGTLARVLVLLTYRAHKGRAGLRQKID